MTDLQKNSAINIRGDLQIIRRDAQGHLESVWDKKNTVTFGGTDLIIRLLAPNAVFGPNVQLENQIKSLRLGTSNITPQRTDTGLISEAVVSGSPVRIEFFDANRLVGALGTVEFTATLGIGDGNGVTYREAGLFTRGTANDPLVTTAATMFARQVFPDQVKTAAVQIEFRWRLTLTA